MFLRHICYFVVALFAASTSSVTFISESWAGPCTVKPFTGVGFRVPETNLPGTEIRIFPLTAGGLTFRNPTTDAVCFSAVTPSGGRTNIRIPSAFGTTAVAAVEKQITFGGKTKVIQFKVKGGPPLTFTPITVALRDRGFVDPLELRTPEFFLAEGNSAVFADLDLGSLGSAGEDFLATMPSVGDPFAIGAGGRLIDFPFIRFSTAPFDFADVGFDPLPPGTLLRFSGTSGFTAVVPEPAVLALLSLGLAALALARGRDGGHPWQSRG